MELVSRWVEPGRQVGGGPGRTSEEKVEQSRSAGRDTGLALFPAGWAGETELLGSVDLAWISESANSKSCDLKPVMSTHRSSVSSSVVWWQ